MGRTALVATEVPWKYLEALTTNSRNFSQRLCKLELSKIRYYKPRFQSFLT